MIATKKGNVMKPSDILKRAWGFIEGSSMSCTDICLLLFLMNESGYSEEPFQCPNAKIMDSIGINRSVLSYSRNSLIRTGIIRYSKGNRRCSPPTYSVLNSLFKAQPSESCMQKNVLKIMPKIMSKTISDNDCVSTDNEALESELCAKNYAKSSAKNSA